MPARNKSYFLLIIGVIAVSTAAILIKLALPYANPLEISFFRMLFSTMIAVLIYQLSKEKVPLRSLTHKQITLLILAGIFLALHFALWTWSLEKLSVSSSVFFVTTTPLWVGLLTPLIFNEKVPARFYWGLLLALIGGLIITLFNDPALQNSQMPNTSLGLFLALAGAWMASAYFTIGKKLSSQIATKLYVTIVYTVATLVLGSFLLVGQGRPGLSFQPIAFLLFFLMAIIPQTLGHTSFNTALRFLPASTVALALLFEPIGSTILAIALLKVMPTTAEIVGGIFILLGLVIAINPKTNAA